MGRDDLRRLKKSRNRYRNSFVKSKRRNRNNRNRNRFSVAPGGIACLTMFSGNDFYQTGIFGRKTNPEDRRQQLSHIKPYFTT